MGLYAPDEATREACASINVDRPRIAATASEPPGRDDASSIDVHRPASSPRSACGPKREHDSEGGHHLEQQEEGRPYCTHFIQ